MNKVQLYELAEQLRDESGCSITICVNALKKFDNNFNKSIEFLKNNCKKWD